MLDLLIDIDQRLYGVGMLVIVFIALFLLSILLRGNPLVVFVCGISGGFALATYMANRDRVHKGEPVQSPIKELFGPKTPRPPGAE